MVISALITFLASLISISAFIWFVVKTKEAVDGIEKEPCWEVVAAKDSDDEIGYLVRWSDKDATGRYLWVGHYYAGPENSLRWCKQAAESHAARLNFTKKCPWEYLEWRR